MANYRVTVLLESGEKESVVVYASCMEEAEHMAENKLKMFKYIYLVEKLD